MASKETDEHDSFATTFIENAGTSLKAALDVARKFGCVGGSLLAFDSAKLYAGDPESFYLVAAQFKITSYVNLGTDPARWRQWLATNGPILTRLNVDATWDSATQTKGNLDAYKSDTARSGHAIALVGYTPERFTVRNSWGEKWGDKGFAYATDEYAQAAFTEAYGVTV